MVVEMTNIEKELMALGIHSEADLEAYIKRKLDYMITEGMVSFKDNKYSLKSEEELQQEMEALLS